MSKRQATRAILEVLGIELDGVISAVIKVDGLDWPEITVTKQIRGGIGNKEITSEYVLVDKKPAPKVWPE